MDERHLSSASNLISAASSDAHSQPCFFRTKPLLPDMLSALLGSGHLQSESRQPP